MESSREDTTRSELFMPNKMQKQNGSCMDDKTTNFSTSNASAFKLLFGKSSEHMNFNLDDQLSHLVNKSFKSQIPGMQG